MFGMDDAIAAGSTLIDHIVTRVWPDANEVEKAKLAQVSQEITAQYALMLEQVKVNEAEAQSEHWFTANWRPFIGWVCGLALAYSSIFEPVLRFLATVLFDYQGSFPVIDTTVTMQILFGMLGLGAMRSYDKAQVINKR